MVVFFTIGSNTRKQIGPENDSENTKLIRRLLSLLRGRKLNLQLRFIQVSGFFQHMKNIIIIILVRMIEGPELF